MWDLLTLSKHTTWPTMNYYYASSNATESPPNLSKQSKQYTLTTYAYSKLKEEKVEIPQSVGVRQGDNMAPVLFLFLMTAFAETLEIVWKQQ